MTATEPELTAGAAPGHRSLQHHDGAWWFPLRDRRAATEVHADLESRFPGRVVRRAGVDRLPTWMAGW